MSRRKKTPNYNLLFDSAVSGLQKAFNEYVSLQSLFFEFFAVNSDGDFVILSDVKKMREKIDKAEAEVIRLKAEVEKYRELKGRGEQ